MLVAFILSSAQPSPEELRQYQLVNDGLSARNRGEYELAASNLKAAAEQGGFATYPAVFATLELADHWHQAMGEPAERGGSLLLQAAKATGNPLFWFAWPEPGVSMYAER